MVHQDETAAGSEHTSRLADGGTIIGDTAHGVCRLRDIERWSGLDLDRTYRAKEVLGGRVSVGYVEDDSLVAIIGQPL